MSLHAVDVVGGGGGGGGAGVGSVGGGEFVDVVPVTDTAAALLIPSAVAVMLAFPTATPVTRPLPETAAIELLEVFHVTV